MKTKIDPLYTKENVIVFKLEMKNHYKVRWYP